MRLLDAELDLADKEAIELTPTPPLAIPPGYVLIDDSLLRGRIRHWEFARVTGAPLTFDDEYRRRDGKSLGLRASGDSSARSALPRRRRTRCRKGQDVR